MRATRLIVLAALCGASLPLAAASRGPGARLDSELKEIIQEHAADRLSLARRYFGWRPPPRAAHGSTSSTASGRRA